jgi:hypothetical protein
VDVGMYKQGWVSCWRGSCLTKSMSNNTEGRDAHLQPQGHAAGCSLLQRPLAMSPAEIRGTLNSAVCAGAPPGKHVPLGLTPAAAAAAAVSVSAGLTGLLCCSHLVWL